MGETIQEIDYRLQYSTDEWDSFEVHQIVEDKAKGQKRQLASEDFASGWDCLISIQYLDYRAKSTSWSPGLSWAIHAESWGRVRDRQTARVQSRRLAAGGLIRCWQGLPIDDVEDLALRWQGLLTGGGAGCWQERLIFGSLAKRKEGT